MALAMLHLYAIVLSFAGGAALRTQPQVPASQPQACELPSDAMWCTVSLSSQGQAIQFEMAVYKAADIVSSSICGGGHWEFYNVDQYGPPGNALDIGGNVGYYSLSLAKVGWTVQTFEPLPQNLALIRASLCKNPDVAERITVHAVGLGPHKDHCEIISGNDNVGDGNMFCGPSQPVPLGNSVLGSFEVAVLDEMLGESGVERIDFLKIDVEGMECEVFRGGQSVLSNYKPRLIQSEVWGTMKNCSANDYLDMFSRAGYNVSKDVNCQLPVDSLGSIQDVFMCNSTGSRRLRGDSGARRVVILRAP